MTRHPREEGWVQDPTGYWYKLIDNNCIWDLNREEMTDEIYRDGLNRLGYKNLCELESANRITEEPTAAMRYREIADVLDRMLHEQLFEVTPTRRIVRTQRRGSGTLFNAFDDTE